MFLSPWPSLIIHTGQLRRFAALSALAFALAATFHHAPAYATPNLVCKPSTGGHGVAPGKAIARIKAKGHWSKRVKTAYGAGWAQFSNAQDPSFKCQRKATLWGCAVSAKPCKELGLTQSEDTHEVKTVSHTTR